jgi:glycosyltransferase involved in cell wall biosynthesis
MPDDMPRTICMLTSVHPPFDPRVFHREARSLAAAGYAVTLIAQHGQREEIRDGVRIVGLPQARSRLGRPLNWTRLLRLALRERADAYHFHDPELIPWGLLLRGLTGRPVVYDAHEHYPDSIMVREWIPAPLRRMVSRVFDGFERAASRRFDAVIVADDDVEARFRPIARRLVTLYNFPHKGLFEQPSPPPADLPAPRPVQLVYVGLITPERGGYLMLEALDRLRRDYGIDAGLWLAGRIPDPDLRAAVEGAADRVNWLGTIPHESLPALLRAATIGWVPFLDVPKLRKNIATKQFEYMACGLPVLGSDLPPIARFVTPAHAGTLVPPGDPSAHAAAIARMVQHPAKLHEMGIHGKKAFLTRYNWDTEEAKLIDLYRALIGPPGEDESP